MPTISLRRHCYKQILSHLNIMIRRITSRGTIDAKMTPSHTLTNQNAMLAMPESKPLPLLVDEVCRRGSVLID
jgi:hypothetical protein